MLNKIEKIGYVGFRWHEAPWDAETTYTPRSLVALNQTIYYAKKESTGVDPRTDTAHESWAVFVDNSSTYAAAVAAEAAAIKAKDATVKTEAATEQANKTIANMVEKINACIAATDAANTAAERANASADAADAATERANTASGKSEGLISDTEKALKTATEITAKANTLVAGVEQAERERIASEAERETAEQQRAQNEQVRQQAEQTRNENENIRKGDESARKESETQRENAEATRNDNETARKSNETARQDAETARAKAEDARVEAEAKRAKAESARKESETQREADFVASKQAAEAATNKALDVSAHAPYVDADGYYYKYNADTKAYDKTDVNLTGKAFAIKKVFRSVEAMNAVSADTFAENDFILINTADVEDEDNAKLYVVAKDEQDNKFYSYLVDMSGFRGFTGKTPQIVIGTVTTLASGEQASVSLTADGVDADGNPKYKLSLAIPKGDKLVFGDLTDSDIATLQKPAIDAAKKADAAVETINTTNTNVQTAETARVKAESGRVEAEKQRAADENVRKQSETARETAEESRKTEEGKRTTAETARKTAEDARIASESARNTAENNRSQAEVARDNAETSRAQAETKRVDAEAKRETDFANSKKACDDATEAAKTATTNAENATTKAENVNVTITDDNSVHVTDREGNQRSLSLAEQAETKATLDKLQSKFDALSNQTGYVGFSRLNGDASGDAQVKFGNKELMHEIGAEWKLATVKDGKVTHIAAAGRLTLDINGEEMKIDGTDGDVMLLNYNANLIKGTKVIDGKETNIIGIGKTPCSWYGVTSKKLPAFGMTPCETVLAKLDGDVRSQAHCIYNKEVKANYTAPNAIFVESYKKDGGGYFNNYQSAVASIQQAQNKNADALTCKPYMGWYYETYEALLTTMYAELGSLKHTDINVMGCGCTNTGFSSTNFNDSAISGTSGFKFITPDGTEKYLSIWSQANINKSDSNVQIIDGICGGAHYTFIENLEEIRVLDAINKAGLVDKIGYNANIFTYDADGNMSCVSDGSINLDTGEGMETLKFYYLVRNVPNCEGLADGVMTAVVNRFVKLTVADNVYMTDKTTSLAGSTCIFKVSLVAYRGFCLPMRGLFRQMSYAYYTAHNVGGVLSMDFRCTERMEDVAPLKKFDSSVYQGAYGTTPAMIANLPNKEDMDVTITGEFWVKSSDYNLSLFCCKNKGGGFRSHENAYLWVYPTNNAGNNTSQVHGSVVGCYANHGGASARSACCYNHAGAGYDIYAGAFAVLLNQ